MRNTENIIKNMNNPDAAGLLCNLILQDTVSSPRPWVPEILEKQKLIKQKNKEKIKKQILFVFTEFKRLISFHIDKWPITGGEKQWPTIFQNINVLPNLVDVSIILSSFNAENYDKQIRELYVNANSYGAISSFFDAFAYASNLDRRSNTQLFDCIYYRNETNRLIRATMLFLCDLWACCLIRLYDAIELACAYKNNQSIHAAAKNL